VTSFSICILGILCPPVGIKARCENYTVKCRKLVSVIRVYGTIEYVIHCANDFCLERSKLVKFEPQMSDSCTTLFSIRYYHHIYCFERTLKCDVHVLATSLINMC